MQIASLLLALALMFLGLFGGQRSGDSVGDLPVAQHADSTPTATSTPSDALQAVTDPQSEETEQPSVSQIDKVLTNIHDVAIRVLEKHPMLMTLEVTGEHPDGCDFPAQTTQRRDGNVVSVEVYREIPSDVFCPMILQPYRGTIHLDGDFDFGEYTIKVNDHTQTIEL